MKPMFESCPNLAHHKRWVWVLSFATAGLLLVVFREHLVAQLINNDTVFKGKDGIRLRFRQQQDFNNFKKNHNQNPHVHPIESLHHDNGSGTFSFISDNNTYEFVDNTKSTTTTNHNNNNNNDNSDKIIKMKKNKNDSTDVSEQNKDALTVEGDPKKITPSKTTATTTTTTDTDKKKFSKDGTSSSKSNHGVTKNGIVTDDSKKEVKSSLVGSNGNNKGRNDTGETIIKKDNDSTSLHMKKKSKKQQQDEESLDSNNDKKDVPKKTANGTTEKEKKQSTDIIHNKDVNQESSYPAKKVKDGKDDHVTVKSNKNASTTNKPNNNKLSKIDKQQASSNEKNEENVESSDRTSKVDVVDPAVFREKYCQLQGVEWYPTGSNEWQQRAPYFLIAGAYKSGTTSMASYLSQHPNIAQPLRGSNLPSRTTELQFFLYRNFRRFVSYTPTSLLSPSSVNNGDGNDSSLKTNHQQEQKTLVRSARTVMLARHYHKKILTQDTSMISFDSTPGYLLYSSILPQRILCVAPWVKILVVLRNPVDRVYSNYLYNVRLGGLHDVSFEDWIESDFEHLRQTGVIRDEWMTSSTNSSKKGNSHDGLTFQDFSGSDEETTAWTQYLLKSDEHAIGRSMYSIQLRHWFKALEDIGRDPMTELHIVRSEDLLRDVDGEYSKVLEFLGLPRYELKSKTKKLVGDHTQPMQDATRKKLEDFFAPYNQQLYKLLGGRDWDNFWEK